MLAGFRKQPFFKALAAENDGGDASCEDSSAGVVLSSIGMDERKVRVARKSWIVRLTRRDGPVSFATPLLEGAARSGGHHDCEAEEVSGNRIVL